MPPSAGDRAPAFELLDHEGRVFASRQLKGQPYVIYFYPKDNTPGCTREAQDFRDQAASFAKLGMVVIGSSPDSSRSHLGFREKLGLGFSLLSDPERSVAQAFGAYGLKKMMGKERMGIIRSTFLIDEKGLIRRAWRGVRVDGHVAEVLEAAQQLR